MSDYPVQLDVTSPGHFDRIQLLLRMMLAIVLGWAGITAGWLACALYFVLPLVAAVAISALPAGKYVNAVAPEIEKILQWILRFGAFMALLVDRFPTVDAEQPVNLRVRYTGQPTTGSALLRLILSIPSAFVVGILACIGSILWVVAALFVLLGARMPDSVLAYQRGLLRWQARLFAYHASFVEEYPPFSFETDRGSNAALRATSA